MFTIKWKYSEDLIGNGDDASVSQSFGFAEDPELLMRHLESLGAVKPVSDLKFYWTMPGVCGYFWITEIKPLSQLPRAETKENPKKTTRKR